MRVCVARPVGYLWGVPSRPFCWRAVAPSPSPAAPRLTIGGVTDTAEREERDPRDDARPRHVHVDLQTATRPASAARRAVDEQCAGRVPPELVEDLRVIASELVANVLQHGGGSRGLTLDVTIREREVDIQVIGRGDRRSLPPSSEWRLPPPSATSGRGLAIVRELAAWVAVDGDEPVQDRDGWIGITASVSVRDAGPAPATPPQDRQ